MNYDFSIGLLNPPCESPAEAELRIACEAGLQFASLEDSLKLTPGERLAAHDRFVNDFLNREEFLNVLAEAKQFIGQAGRSQLTRKSKI